MGDHSKNLGLVQSLSISHTNVCLWAKGGPLNLGFVQSLSSPISVKTHLVLVFFQSLSNPKYVQKVSNIRVCKYIGCYIGESVDKCWIFLSNLCPKTIDLDRISTSVRQRLDRPCTFSAIGQTLDRIRTDIGQRLDFMSKVCPTAVQPPIVKEDRILQAS